MEDLTLCTIHKGERVKVSRISRLGRNVLGGSVYLTVVNSGSRMLAASQWTFRTQRSKSNKAAFADSLEQVHDPAALLKQFGTIEQELLSLQKLEPHPNVIKYESLLYQSSGGCLSLFVLEEFVQGSNLSFYLSENLGLELDMLRHVVSGILEALAFMHKHNFVHRDLRDTSVFVENSGTVRVGDFSIDKRVRDLWQQSNQHLLPHLQGQETRDSGGQTAAAAGVAPDERFPVAIGRGGKKVDIYR